MKSLFPPEANNYLSPEALGAGSIRFFVGRINGQVLGCGALSIHRDYGELKSMYLSEPARGSGLADALIQRLEAEARSLGITRLKLETGDLLTAAQKFYLRHGFSFCGCFGDYDPGPHNIFMEKSL